MGVRGVFKSIFLFIIFSFIAFTWGARRADVDGARIDPGAGNRYNPGPRVSPSQALRCRFIHGIVEVSFSLRTAGTVTLGVYDVSGRRLLHRTACLGEGEHVVCLGARSLRRGVYIVHLEGKGERRNAKLLVP
jgi:hypothetical protein